MRKGVCERRPGVKMETEKKRSNESQVHELGEEKKRKNERSKERVQ